MSNSKSLPITIDEKNGATEAVTGTTKESTDNKNTTESTKKDSEGDVIKILTLILSMLSFIIAVGAWLLFRRATGAQ
jgi:hypothetical protein